MGVNETPRTAAIVRTVREAPRADAGRAIARLAPADMAALGLVAGEIVAIRGERTAHARALPIAGADGADGVVLIDGVQRANAGAGVGATVQVSRVVPPAAREVVIDLPPGVARLSDAFTAHVRQALSGHPVASGCGIQLALIGGGHLGGTISQVVPDGLGVVNADTRLTLRSEGRGTDPGLVGYEDVGGLRRELDKVREVVEWPIRRPELFAALGIEAPRGLLLSGPPGTGKTLIARVVAQESACAFFQINGPEIIGKHYGESEAELRAIFEQAAKRQPAIIFIDELDAIAPKRDGLTGDKQVERRIVAQLLTLMDGLSSRGRIIVMAATNLPDSLDPALRRPGRFDREITIGVPDRAGRREILNVHMRGMPLDPAVDLDAIAAATHGFVGADLAALAREVGMAALRRLGAGLTDAELNEAIATNALKILPADIGRALAEVRPSAIREVYTDVPEVHWEDVGGLDDVKDMLREAVIWPLSHPHLFDQFGVTPPKGALLAGPPGVGKTLIAQALATEAQVNFISVRGPQLLNQYVGESEKAVRSVFAKARATAPCILFFDEIDALAPVRGSGDGPVSERIVAQLLTEIDGIEDLVGVFLLGATNRPDRIDPALKRPGRFDAVIEIALPDAGARARILAIHARRVPLAPDVELSSYAARTDGFSGADLAALVQTAARRAVRRAMTATDAGAVRLEIADLDAALAELTRTRALRGGARVAPTTMETP